MSSHSVRHDGHNNDSSSTNNISYNENEQELFQVPNTSPNADVENFDNISFHENNREFFDDDSTVLSDSLCSSSVGERAEIQQIPNGIAMHALTSSLNSNPSNGVAIQSSSGITVGSKNFFSGNVVIKQFMAEGEVSKRKEAENGNFGTKQFIQGEISKPNETENSHSGGKKFKMWWKKHCCSTKGNFVIMIAFTMFVVLFATITAIFTLLKHHKGGDYRTSIPGITVPETVDQEIVTRSTWGALPPQEYENLQLPVKRVIISHTVTPQCMNFDDCCNKIRTMQENEMIADPDPDADIAVNFLVGGDSRAYEGKVF